MEPEERKLVIEAISATLCVFQGSEPLLSPVELASLSDREARYALADLHEAVRGMNAVELHHLSSELEGRGLSLTKMMLEAVSVVSSIARRKVWSEADLILLSASADVLPPDVKDRIRLERRD